MKAYRIYLTNSYEVAELLAEGVIAKENRGQWMRGKKVTSLTHGAINRDEERIPDVCKDNAKYHCTVEYESDKPEYEIVFA